MISDPNQDNWSETNPSGTENNNSLDSYDEQAAEDYNGDGIYTVYANYDNANEIYIWDGKTGKNKLKILVLSVSINYYRSIFQPWIVLCSLAF